ncbi:MAG TPA: hypothetical protein DCP31_09055 [Cyanobacteria bacterium UBA8543]|nr:hypothetical protein [Cyanobacteria bacterium UBA8543]
MAKVALLIGVSEYGPELNPLPGAIKDVEAVKQVLQPLEIGGFDEVKLLLNPNPPVMREAIETLFSSRTKNDLVLLFFAGHIIQDDSGKLYFATCITSKSPKAEHIRVSTIPASFVHNLMSNISCQRQVVILDGCFRNLSTEIAVNHDGTADIKTQLGGEGRTILTSFTFIHNSFNSQGFNPSPYTRYLVEGIRTGAADLDSDGWISVDELHQYASNKVQTVAPAVKPEFYTSENGSKILLAKVLLDNPELKYRKEAESWIRCGEISEGGRYILSKLAESLELSSQDCTVIEDEVLKPYQEYQEKLQCYKHNFAKAVSKDYPLGTQEREDLKSLQQSLGLREEDIAPIEERITLKLANLSPVEDNVDELTQSDSESQLNSLSSTFSTLIPESKLVPPLVLTNLTPESEDDTNKPVQSDSQSQQNSVPSEPSVVTPESTPIPAIAASNPTRAVNLSSSLPDSQTSSVSASTFPKKSILIIGIGGALATLAVAIGIVSRTQVAPPVPQTNNISSSPSLSSKPSPTTPNSNQEPSPSPSALPDSKDCLIFVNGNLRSEPVAFRDNVVESLREPVPVTGKRTKEGWVQVKMTTGRLGWAHPEIISNDSEKEMEACLSRKRISTNIIQDIPPPTSSSSQ